MPRPSKNTPLDRFTTSELAVAAKISQRQFNILIENDRAPAPVGPQPEGPVKLWDSRGLAETALLGAIHASGPELLMSAKLSRIMIDDFEGNHAQLPSRVRMYLTEKSLNPNAPNYPWPKTVELTPEQQADDFWIHYFLRSKAENYVAGQSISGDLIYELADRQFLFSSSHSDLAAMKHTPIGSRPSNEPDPEIEIVGWARGREAEFRRFYQSPAQADDDYRTWLDTYKNSVSILRLNISLAIRNGFDAVYDSRVALGRHGYD